MSHTLISNLLWLSFVHCAHAIWTHHQTTHSHHLTTPHTRAREKGRGTGRGKEKMKFPQDPQKSCLFEPCLCNQPTRNFEAYTPLSLGKNVDLLMTTTSLASGNHLTAFTSSPPHVIANLGEVAKQVKKKPFCTQDRHYLQDPDRPIPSQPQLAAKLALYAVLRTAYCISFNLLPYPYIYSHIRTSRRFKTSTIRNKQGHWVNGEWYHRRTQIRQLSICS